jgi:CheY-like chemotaxis protein
MLARKYWNILIVDDEPDVHQVTELMLKKEQFFGVKPKFHHANSAAEAIEMTKAPSELDVVLAVALVDVVMETDHAGLDFCKHVREVRNRQSTALILRTGQPGVAPPRRIIDDYNITGYLTKMEATQDRLYMLIKQGIQRYYETSLVQNRNQMMDFLRSSAQNPEDMLQRFATAANAWSHESNRLNAAHDFFGEHYVGCGDFADKAAYLAVKDELLSKAANELKDPRRGVALIEPYAVIQTPVAFGTKVVTMVLKDAVLPRNMAVYYGSIIRQGLAYMGEILARR